MPSSVSSLLRWSFAQTQPLFSGLLGSQKPINLGLYLLQTLR